MKIFRIILSISFLLLTISSYSQNIKQYKSDFSVKIILDKDESPESGSIDDVMKANVSIIHNMTNSTIEFKLSDHNRRIYFFKDVKYSETFINNGNKYTAYTAIEEDGTPYFISLGDNIIKVDNRKTYMSIGFNLVVPPK